MRWPRWIGLALAVVVVSVVAIAWRRLPAPPTGKPPAGQLAPVDRTGAGTLMSSLHRVNGSGLARGLIPPSRCTQDSETTVTCMAPAPGITGVVFTTYPSLRSLYAAYVARVRSLNAGHFNQNRAGCGLSGPSTVGEAGWSYGPRPPAAFSVAQMAGGQVTEAQAAGRVFCVASAGGHEDVVWTQGDDQVLGWVAGEPRPHVWRWWAAVHGSITGPGSAGQRGS